MKTPNRGFTLIELLVVISIIAMLSSVILAALYGARAKGRDAVRIEETHQIDLAINLYKVDHNGNAPDLQGACSAENWRDNITMDVSSCVALSSADPNSPQGKAWSLLQSDLKPYFPNLPKDPCGTNCTTGNGDLLTYKYLSPLVMKATCEDNNQNCTQNVGTLDQSYYLCASLEADPNDCSGNVVITDIEPFPFYPNVSDIRIYCIGCSETSDTVTIISRSDPSYIENTLVNGARLPKMGDPEDFIDFEPDPTLSVGDYTIYVTNTDGIKSNSVELTVVNRPQ